LRKCDRVSKKTILRGDVNESCLLCPFYYEGCHSKSTWKIGLVGCRF